MQQSNIDVNEILFRCSGLGNLMTVPKLKGEFLSEGAKTHALKTFITTKYNRYKEITSKYLTKGNDTEEDSITVLSRIDKKRYRKNDQMLKNDFIKGTPDIFEGPEITNADHITDTKSSWDLETFLTAKYAKLKQLYYWQGQGYMWLTGAKSCTIAYVLNDTPWGLIEAELRKESYKYPEGDTPAWVEAMIIQNHVYNKETFLQYLDFRNISESKEHVSTIIKGFVEMPLEERHFKFEFDRNESDLELLKIKIINARTYIKNNLL